MRAPTNCRRSGRSSGASRRRCHAIAPKSSCSSGSTPCGRPRWPDRARMRTIASHHVPRRNAMRPLSLILLAASAAFALPAAAQSLKPGLWEMQHKVQGNAQMDQAMAEMQKQLAGMSPEQRKQMETMMASRGVQMAPGADGGMRMKICMTKEMAERNDIPANRGDCKTGPQQRSGNTVKMAFTCTNPPSSGDAQFTFNGS